MPPMLPRSILVAVVISTAGTGVARAGDASPPRISEKTIGEARFTALPDKSTQRADPEVVKAEVLLDRAHFSPGVIDGIDGDNFRKALAAYQKQMNISPSGRLDQATWDKLNSDTASPLTNYKISAADTKGPFTKKIPARFEAQARLKHLGYHDVREMLAEKFHISISLLVVLNPGSGFHAGQQIKAPSVERQKPTDAAARVVVDKTGHDVEAFSADGRLLAFYPASIGSPEKPAPSGSFEIRRVVHHPNYTYLPRYHFRGVKANAPFTIAPGPNNPVGTVWIDLSYEGYGIHGTPTPEAIGKTQSHGCIRLTNWDAENLAGMVDKGVQVSFQDAPGMEGPALAMPTAANPALAEHDGQPGAQPADPAKPTKHR